MQRCRDCPVSDDVECVSRTHPRYCDLASDPRYRSKIVARSGEHDPNSEPFPSRDPSNGRLRVGFLAPCLFVGGTEVHNLALAKSLDPARFVLRGLVVYHDHATIHDPTRDGFRRLMPVAVGRRHVATLAKECDILIGWGRISTDLIDGMVRLPRLVVVSHVSAEWKNSGSDYDSGTWIPDRIVAVSELAVDPIPVRLRDRVDIIYPGVDPDRLQSRRSRDEIRASWGLNQNIDVVVGYLGRLSPEKDPLAMKRMVDYLPRSWRVVIAGEGGLRDEMVRVAPDLMLVGAHSPGEFLAAIDVLVVPSLHESFGLSIAEAVLSGIPLVSTPVGLARIVPGTATVEIPIHSDGPTLAKATIAAVKSGPIEGISERIRSLTSMKFFGDRWMKTLETIAAPRPISLDSIERVVLLTSPGRYPEGTNTTLDQLKKFGVEPIVFLNAAASDPRVESIGRDRFAMLHPDAPPDMPMAGVYYHALALVEIVRRAIVDGIETLLFVEDDCDWTENALTQIAATPVPADWQLLYYGAFHAWNDTADAGPGLLRLAGSTGTHALAIRRPAFYRIVDIDLKKNDDNQIANMIHPSGTAYALWPSVAIQRPGRSLITGQESDPTALFAIKGKNWPDPEKSSGIGKSLRSLGRSARRIGSDLIARGSGAFASQEIQEERKALCLACPYVAHEGRGCRVCTCGTDGKKINAIATYVGLDMGLKRSIASERCALEPPVWGPV